MKFRGVIFFAVAIFFICINSCSVFQNSSKKTIEDRLQRILNKVYDKNQESIGLIAHVESPSRNISWSGAVGYADKKKTIQLSAENPVWIASNTKTYVSATILRLVELDKLKLEDPIQMHLTNKTKELLNSDDYDLSKITIQHLLSHTSGIFDYVNADEFFETVEENPMHEWTRDSQIKLAIEGGEPEGGAGQLFGYADTNYSLLTEIMEEVTGAKYYELMRELLKYEELGLRDTWFLLQEEKPTKSLRLAEQHNSEMGINTVTMHPSFDLFGGGGIAATAHDLAMFSQALFNNKIFDNKETLELIYTKANPHEPMQGDYRLGLTGGEVEGLETFGHGGYWGTVVLYVPELDASIAVFVLERNKRILRKELNELIVNELKSI